jgi:hypothetical protein
MGIGLCLLAAALFFGATAIAGAIEKLADAENLKLREHIADMELRLRRVNAINDNPAAFNEEIAELTAPRPRERQI